jgi:hypothetical protein
VVRLDGLVAGGVVLDFGEGVAVSGEVVEVEAMPVGGAVAPPGVITQVGLACREHQSECDDLGAAIVGLLDQLGQRVRAAEPGRLLAEEDGSELVGIVAL